MWAFFYERGTPVKGSTARGRFLSEDRGADQGDKFRELETQWEEEKEALEREPTLRSMRAIEADQTLASLMRGIAAALVPPPRDTSLQSERT